MEESALRGFILKLAMEEPALRGFILISYQNFKLAMWLSAARTPPGAMWATGLGHGPSLIPHPPRPGKYDSSCSLPNPPRPRPSLFKVTDVGLITRTFFFVPVIR